MANQLSKKYPDYAFIKVSTHSKNITIKKEKYMISREMTVGQFLYYIRNERVIKTHSNQSITLFVNNVLPKITDYIGIVYEKYKKDDDILYVSIETENVFG